MLVAFTVPGRGRGGIPGAIAEEGFLDAPGVRDSDALVDRQCLP
jgi:hypothetical protein